MQLKRSLLIRVEVTRGQRIECETNARRFENGNKQFRAFEWFAFPSAFIHYVIQIRCNTLHAIVDRIVGE